MMKKNNFTCKKPCTAIFFLTNNTQRGLCMDKKPTGGVEEGSYIGGIGIAKR